jgi:hypothetical protein
MVYLIIIIILYNFYVKYFAIYYNNMNALRERAMNS